jgi:hypothetical protein
VAAPVLERARRGLSDTADKVLAEAMSIRRTVSVPAEICVENVKRLRLAADEGRYEATFQGLNAAMADLH